MCPPCAWDNLTRISGSRDGKTSRLAHRLLAQCENKSFFILFCSIIYFVCVHSCAYLCVHMCLYPWGYVWRTEEHTGYPGLPLSVLFPWDSEGTGSESIAHWFLTRLTGQQVPEIFSVFCSPDPRSYRHRLAQPTIKVFWLVYSNALIHGANFLVQEKPILPTQLPLYDWCIFLVVGCCTNLQFLYYFQWFLPKEKCK